MVDCSKSKLKEESLPYLQCFCPICLLILREPYQVTCCGKSYCRGCIEQVKANSQPCPACKESTFKIFQNKGIQRPLHSFHVFCSHKESGCDWQGKLGELDQHLNVNAEPEKLLAGCAYAEVRCLFCKERHQRKDIETHQTSKCTERPYTCEMCREYKSGYNAVKTQHAPVCKCRPVDCPNSCGVRKLQHQHLAEHLAKCPLSIVKCDFSEMGCRAKIRRRDLNSHLQNSVVGHMSLLALGNRRMRSQLQAQDTKIREQAEKIRKQEEKITKQAHEITKLSEALEREKKFIRSFPLSTPPLEIVYTGLKAIEYTGGITSKPFYTHIGGPKLQLELIQPLVAYMIQYTFLESEFEFSDELKLCVTAQVLDQVGENHLKIEHMLMYSKSVGDVSYRHTLLQVKPEHTQNDRLMMRVVSIKTI